MKNLLKIAAISLSLSLLACTDVENVNEQVQPSTPEIQMVNVGTPYEAPYMDISNMDKEQVLSLSNAELEVYLKNAFPIIQNSYKVSSIVLNTEPVGSRKYDLSKNHLIYLQAYFVSAKSLQDQLTLTGKEPSIEEMFEPMVDAYQLSAEYLKLMDQIDAVEGE